MTCGGGNTQHNTVSGEGAADCGPGAGNTAGPRQTPTVAFVRWDIDPLTVVLDCEWHGTNAVEWELDRPNRTVYATCPGCGAAACSEFGDGDVLLCYGDEYDKAARLYDDVRRERLYDEFDPPDCVAAAYGAMSGFEADWWRSGLYGFAGGPLVGDAYDD